MKTKSKERRVINIPKEDYDKIKNYCDKKSLNMSKWIIHIIHDTILKSRQDDELYEIGFRSIDSENNKFFDRHGKEVTGDIVGEFYTTSKEGNVIRRPSDITIEKIRRMESEYNIQYGNAKKSTSK